MRKSKICKGPLKSREKMKAVKKCKTNMFRRIESDVVLSAVPVAVM
jgi:hypothetical protein